MTDLATSASGALRRLREAPDPERAMALAQGVLAAQSPERLRQLEGDPADALAHALFAFCGVAPFFAPFLQRHPEWLGALLDEDLTRPLGLDSLRSRLDAQVQAAASIPRAAEALRRFKYYELARITLRDCSPECVPLADSSETLTELSQLADVLLARALEVARFSVSERFGPPRWRTRDGGFSMLAFAAIALGKLGGEELNFSSDVDLVYVFETPPALAANPDRPAPNEYFTRVAQVFGRLVGDATPDGFLYRIDLDLRPAGAQGTLVVTADALASYYEIWADTWEKATFTKARPVAGNLNFGWRAIRSVDPMIYRSSMDYAAVRGIRALKERFERERGGGDTFDVKLDPGGIREIEFIAQALQLLHAGRIPQIRQRSTPSALASLSGVGLLDAESAEELLDDYLFLRRVENRLQMEAERQTHRVPTDPDALTRLAQAYGIVGEDPGPAFEQELERRRMRVRSAYDSLLARAATGGAEPIIDIFARGAPKLFTLPASRRLMEALAANFAHEIDDSSDPERALNNLQRFVQSIGGRRFYYELLLDRPELVPRLAALFGASKFLSEYLIRHPRRIEPLFSDPERLLCSPSQLQAQWQTLRSSWQEDPGNAGRDPVELRLDALRIFHDRETLNIGLLDLASDAAVETPDGAGSVAVSRAEIEHALSALAELCVNDALALASEQLELRAGEAVRGDYVVVAMGKLASRELSYGSDLDLIFLFDAVREDGRVDLHAQEHYVRLTQRFISALQTPTTEGYCYEIDARLRPSGNQGTLVTSLVAFERYHAESAQVWERQALLRARPVAGSDRLAARFETLRLKILNRPVPDDLEAEVHRVRQRMELELAQETRGRRNFKTGRGGVLDVESIAQSLQLANGARYPELLEVERTSVQLDRLHARGLLSLGENAALCAGLEFLQRLSSRLRIVDNRSISDLDNERGDLDGLARSLGYKTAGRESASRRALLVDYERHTDAIRAVYRRTLGTQAEDAADQNV